MMQRIPMSWVTTQCSCNLSTRFVWYLNRTLPQVILDHNDMLGSVGGTFVTCSKQVSEEFNALISSRAY